MEAELKEVLNGIQRQMDGFQQQMDGFQQQMDGYQRRMDGFQQQMQQGFAEVRQEFSNVRQEMSAMDSKNAAEHAETRRYFDVVAEDLRDDIRGVADGVLGCNERVDRLTAEMKGEFADVRDLFEISFNALEGRVHNLEGG